MPVDALCLLSDGLVSLLLAFQVLDFVVFEGDFFLVLLLDSLFFLLKLVLIELEFAVLFITLLVDLALVLISELVHLSTLIDDLLSKFVLILFILANGIELCDDFVKVTPAHMQQFFESIFSSTLIGRLAVPHIRAIK